MFEKYRIIHFVGIGGIGMSGIAEVLHNLGYEVTGSDLKESDTTRRLKELGIKLYKGHSEENIGNAHVVVISSAVAEDNPEVVAAHRLAIPVIPRAEMLAEIARMKYSILVAGAHGKTTTTSLISTVLAHGGYDPTVIIGGRLKATGSNAILGQGEFLVAEADESDGSFLKLSPTMAVVTNIDREHMDYFKDMNSLKDAFLTFINKIPFYGTAFICRDNEILRDMLPYIQRRFLTYGFSDVADIHARNIDRGFMQTRFEVFYRQRSLGRFSIPMSGLHNVLNTLACIGVAVELQMDVEAIKEALNEFKGIQRRFEFKGEARGIKVYDDYGHHPTEIRATLSAARDSMRYLGEHGRLFVVFQPHRYTRTNDLMDEFAVSFGNADMLVLLDIYSAGEKPIEGVTSEILASKIRERELREKTDVVHIPDKAMAIEYLLSQLREGDILLTLGAGDVWKIGDKVIERLMGDK